MNYSFPRVEHRVYPHTFLDRASAQIHFNANLSGNLNKLKEFFMENYELGFDEEQLTLLRFKTLVVRSHSANLQLKFSLDFFEVKIGHESYISFEQSLMPFLESFIRLIDSIDGKIYKMTLRKINSWKFNKFPGLSYRALMENVISEPLMSDFPNDADQAEAIDNELTITTFITDKRLRDQALKINFGYSPLPLEDSMTNQPPIRVILDTECVVLDSNALRHKNATRTLIQANQLLFDLYHWAVKPEIVEAMQNL